MLQIREYTPAERNSEQTNFGLRVRKSTAAKLHAIAIHHGKSRNWVVNCAIVAYLEQLEESQNGKTPVVCEATGVCRLN